MSKLVSNKPSISAVTQLGYLGLSVSDMDAWKDFSTDVLGMQLNGETEDGSVFLRMDNYHHRFQLTPSGGDDIAYIGWEAKDAEALEEIAAQVRAYGLDVTVGTPEDCAQRMVLGLIKFNDPDGLPTEIYYGARIDHTPFHSPRGIKSFNADALGLGHLVLGVLDPVEYLAFYTTVLGAKLSDIIFMNRGGTPTSATFLHVNPRHHSLAIGKRAPDAPVKRLNHFMLEVNSLDDVGQTRGVFERRGIPVSNFGRHTNDKMFSFYGQTPSGFRVEFGFDGIQILDEDKWEVGHHTAPSIWGHGMMQRAAVS